MKNILLILINIFITKVISFYNQPVGHLFSPRLISSVVSLDSVHQNKHVLYGLSKKAEVYTKVKRLKQMVEQGKNYQDYINEQKRYNNDDDIVNNQPKPSDTESASEATAELENGMDQNMKLSYRRAVAAGLISKDANPVEVMQRVLQYKSNNQNNQNNDKTKGDP